MGYCSTRVTGGEGTEATGLFMQVRWTLTRFRYDRLVKLGWKGLFPVAVVNVIVTAVVLMLFGGDA